MKNKLIAVLCMMTLFFSVNYAVCNADTGNYETKGDFAYEKGTNNIIAYIGKTGTCELPEDTEVTKLYDRSNPSAPITKLIVNKGVKWNMIPSGELQDFKELKEVVLSEGVTEIPYQAFEQCKSLEKITIPSTVTEIGDYALSNCKSLKTIELPDGLQSIGEYAFSKLPSLSGNITIPDSVTSMGEGAFSYCGDLNKVHLSDNLTYKPAKNYDNSDSLANWFENTEVREINIPDAMLEKPSCNFYADEITFNSDMTVNIYNAVKASSWCTNKYLKGKTDKSLGGHDGFAIAENTVLKYTGTSKNPKVPEGVKSIGEDAFSYCDVDTVGLPSALETIEDSAFYYSTIKSITIPQNVKSIGNDAFDNCPLLEKIVFEGSPEIGLNAVVVTSVLTEDNIVFQNGDKKAKQEILDNGTEEISLYEFYNTLNKNRKKLGFEEVEVPKDATSSKPETNKPTSSPSPTDKPAQTDAPRETNSPVEASPVPNVPETLYVNNGDVISIKVNDKNIIFPDAKPFIDDNGRTQVPVRAVAEILDAKVDWNGQTQTVTISQNRKIVKIVIGSDTMTVDDNAIKMDTNAIISEERTYIPIRFVAEALGLTVEWIE